MPAANMTLLADNGSLAAFQCCPAARWAIWESHMRGKGSMTCVCSLEHGHEVIDELYQHPISELRSKSYLHIFRAPVRPLWEDPCNAFGGHFKVKASSRLHSADVWLALSRRFVDETFCHTHAVNGISIISSGNNLLKVWMNTTDENIIKDVRCFLSTILNPAHYHDDVKFVSHASFTDMSKHPIGCSPAPPRGAQPSTPPMQGVSNGNGYDSDLSRGSGSMSNLSPAHTMATLLLTARHTKYLELQTASYTYVRNPYSLEDPFLFFLPDATQ